MRPKFLILFSLSAFQLFSFFSLAAPVTHRWSAESSTPASVVIPAYQGETLYLEPTLLSYGSPIPLTNDAITFYWRTNGMGSAWWSKPCDPIGTSTGLIRAVFAPTNDFGADQYTFFIQYTSASGSNYRASGIIRMRPSPGFSPAVAPAPGYQWVSPADLASATGALASAISASLTSATGALASASESALASATGALAIASESALASATALCVGGYTISNWWEPVLTATYRATSAATTYTTNSYLIYATSLAETGLIDWSLGYRVLDGWPPPPTWTITDGTNYATIISNRVWGITPGRVTVQGIADGVTRTSILPINYGKVATPVTTLSSLLPGSAAATASLPIIAMASNYLATTTEPLVPRPTDWNTNETYRTNYAAVATWLPTPTWNTNCWLTNAPSLFACTAFAVGTTPQASPLWHGVLISPRIIVKARHVRYNLGQTHWFLTPQGTLTNAVLSRWIDLYPDGGPDIVLGVLDRAMPTSMVARVAAPAQIAAAFPAPTGYQTATYVHAVAFSQHLDASILQLNSISSTTEWQTYWNQPTLPQSLTLGPLYHPAHPGDSGCPIILAWGNTPVLLSLYYYAGSGSSISASLTDIATALAAEGESLTYIDFGVLP